MNNFASMNELNRKVEGQLTEIGKKIALLPDHLGFSKDVLCKKLNIVPNTFRRYEQGKGISLHLILLICETFNIKLSFFVPVPEQPTDILDENINLVVTYLEKLEPEQLDTVSMMTIGLYEQSNNRKIRAQSQNTFRRKNAPART